MTAIQSKQSNCTNCGAKLAATPDAKGEVTCAFCNATFVVAAPAPAPAPAGAGPGPGPVILAADFTAENVPGWLFDDDTASVEDGSSDLVCTFEPKEDETAAYPVESEGTFDDVDVAVTVAWRDWPEGEDDLPATAGLTLRSGDAGYYFVGLACDGTYSVWAYRDDDAQALVEDATHPQLEGEAPVRLRVVAQGAHLKVYLNGVLASSVQDPGKPRLTSGKVGLSLESIDGPAEAAFSALEVREAPQK